MLFEDNTPYLVLKILITILGTFGMSASISRFRSNYRRCLLIFAAYLVCAMAFSFCVIYYGDYMLFSWIFLFITAIPGILMFLLISDEPVAQLVFTRASQILFSLYVAASVGLLNSLLRGNELTDLVLRLLAYLTVTLLEYVLLRRVFLSIAETITKGWGILSLIPCALTVLAVAIGQFPTNYTKTPSSIVLVYLLGVVIVIVYYAIFKYLWMQYNYQMAEQNQKILELQLQNIRSRAADVKTLARQTKIFRQNTIHMLSAVASLAKSGNTAAILNYVEEASAFHGFSVPEHYCSDPILNATFSTYLGRARSLCIAVETHLFLPDTLPVDSAELSICFANALENAIKACEKLPKNERRIIVKCIHRPKLMFEISNPYKGKVTFTRNGLPTSSQAGHGIGTRSIKAFCEKHDAFYSFQAECGWFRVTIVL